MASFVSRFNDFSERGVRDGWYRCAFSDIIAAVGELCGVVSRTACVKVGDHFAMRRLIAAFAVMAVVRAVGASPLPERIVMRGAARTERYDLRFVAHGLPPAGARAVGCVFAFRDARNLCFLALSHKGAQFHKCVHGQWHTVGGPAPLGAVGRKACSFVLRRRPGRLTLEMNGRIVARAYDRASAAGKVGLGVAKAGSPGLGDLRVQPIGQIRLEDEFLGTDAWTPVCGSWRIDAPRDPLIARDQGPPNATRYRGSGPKRSISVAGHAFWDEYSVSVSAMPVSEKACGLVFHFRDTSNYGWFAVSGRGKAVLAVVRDGEVALKREAPYPVQTGVWYRLRVDVAEGYARCRVGSRPVITAACADLISGKPGLFCEAKGDVLFDDFDVRQFQAIHEDFRAPDAGDGKWRTLAGSWCRGSRGVVSESPGLALLAAVPRAPLNPEITLDVERPAAGRAGVAFGLKDEANYYSLAISPGRGKAQDRWELARVLRGGRKVLASGGVPAQPAHRLRVARLHGRIACAVDGRNAARVYDFALNGRGTALVARGSAAFRAVEVVPAERAATAPVFRTDFSAERVAGEHKSEYHRLIGDILKPTYPGLWVRKGSRLGPELQGSAAGASAIWYHDAVPGNARISVQVRPGTAECVGLLAGAHARTRDSGYELRIEKRRLALCRAGKPVAEAAWKGTAKSVQATIARDGRFVVASVGDAHLVYEDPAPLSGTDAGILVQAGTAFFRRLDIWNDLGAAHRFEHVAPDWRPSCGRWVLHSGMTCIAWDHWITAFAEPDALLWNKFAFPRDMRVAFWVSEATEGEETGEHYHFPYHDIRVVVSGDGRTARSGYCFHVAGGPYKDRTRLLRNGEVVAETRGLRIVMGGHCNRPRTFKVGVRRSGGRIVLTINDRVFLSYDDPKPLGPGQIAMGVERCRANFKDFCAFAEKPWLHPDMRALW